MRVRAAGAGAAIVNPLTALDFVGRDLHVRPLTRSFPYRVSVIVPEHRPKSLLVDAFADALRGEAKAIRRRLAALG